MAIRPIDGNDFMRQLTLDTSKGHYGEFMDGSEVAFTSREIATFVEQMPTLTPLNEWVRVDERLPEDGERVIATDGCFTGEAYIDFYGVWCRSNGMRWNMFKTVVTHWMPLPVPPAKDENNT